MTDRDSQRDYRRNDIAGKSLSPRTNPTPDFHRAHPQGFIDWLSRDEGFERHSRRMQLFRKFHDFIRGTQSSRQEASSPQVPLHLLPLYRPVPEKLYAGDSNGPAEWAILIPLQAISVHVYSRN